MINPINSFIGKRLMQEKKNVSDALISAELGQSLKLSELDCKKESNLFGTEIKSRLLEDNDMGWLREQIKRKLIHQGVEIFKQLGTDVEGILVNSDYII